MGKVIMSGIVPPLVAPITGILLSDIAEGSIVKLNENGSPVEFYVAKHDYEATLNGAGRTLMVRKDCYARNAQVGGSNKYASGAFDTWLNGDYKNLFDSMTKVAIGTTKFYYTVGGGDSTVSTIERSVFTVSATELGEHTDYTNVEGQILPTASILKVANGSGFPVDWRTRTPIKTHSINVYGFNTSGVLTPFNGGFFWSRPCLTLPSNALFDEEAMLLKGVT